MLNNNHNDNFQTFSVHRFTLINLVYVQLMYFMCIFNVGVHLTYLIFCIIKGYIRKVTQIDLFIRELIGRLI